jgi:alkanesulfonate monooxygenase
VAGGFRNDLAALGDETPHDERYDRATEYVRLMLRLLAGEVTTVEGRHYRATSLRMTPALPSDLQPGVLMSGSSPAGLAAARAIGAIPVKYPEPPGEEEAAGGESEFGVRIGVIARETAEEAWSIAHERFPEERAGQIAHAVAMKVSDSSWHRQLSRRDASPQSVSEDLQARNPYWLVPFQNYKTFCPYLVGAYERVAGLVAAYIRLGARTFILDIPPSEDELRHTGIVLRAAAEAAG